MRGTLAVLLALVSFVPLALTQTPKKPTQEPVPDEIVRITTELVQTDVVVTDKNDQVINDLKLEDFELLDNGKKQDVKFLEFVGTETGRRAEGVRPSSASATLLPSIVEAAGNTGVSAKDLKRVVAFVVDDLTMQIEDLPAVRNMLSDF